MVSGCVDNMYESFYWGKDSEDKFKKGLLRRVGDIKRILDTPDKQKLICKITEDENFKKKRAPENGNPNWFDNECKIKK